MTSTDIVWTDAARRAREDYFTARLTPERLDGADPAELRADLESHWEEEWRGRKVETVTLEDFRQVLAAMGESLDPAAREPSPPTPPPLPCNTTETAWVPPVPERKFPLPSGWLLFFSVIVPLFSFGFEVVTRGCAELFFDPIPDAAHVLLVLLTPLAGWLFWRWHRPDASSARTRILSLMLGAAVAAAGFYTVLFIPLAPLAAVAILYAGLGLLPFTPAAALAALLMCRARLLRGPSPSAARGTMRAGFWLGVAGIIALEAPGQITHLAIARASDAGAHPAIWAASARSIRRFGSEKTLLRACYLSTDRRFGARDSFRAPSEWIATLPSWNRASDSSPWDPQLTVARDMYFRVTGHSFSDAPSPRTASPLGFNWNNREFSNDIDTDRGGEKVAGRINGLSLAEGRIDWHCEQASGLTWGEWTLTFRNVTNRPEEARCRIALPPGGFVSRVTLWVNGQPEEAAYSTVSKVRAAYQSVAVVQRRDPVLVTQPEPGAVLVQAFPVPANGTLKTRITFTVPAGADHRVWLPAMVERNFDLARATRQPLWVQADGGALEFPAEFQPHAAEEAGKPTLTASLPDSALTGAGTFFTWKHQPAAAVYAEDPFGKPEAKTVVRRHAPAVAITPKAIAWVVDTSASLAPHRDSITAAITKLSPTGAASIFLPGDSPEELVTVTDPKSLTMSFTGGRDNTPALAAAAEWLRGRPDGALLWLHGPQPIGSSARGALEQILDRGVSPLVFLDVPLAPGENTLSPLFAARPRVTALAARHAGSDLASSLLTALHRPGGEFTILPEGTAPPADATRVGDSLARWYAREEAGRLGLTDPAAASALAAGHQVVSPWSGAVVLERATDYARHGLEQSNVSVSQQVPVIPEPSAAVLALLSAGHLLLRRRR